MTDRGNNLVLQPDCQRGQSLAASDGSADWSPMLRTSELQFSLYSDGTFEIRDGGAVYVHLTEEETTQMLKWLDGRNPPKTKLCDLRGRRSRKATMENKTRKAKGAPRRTKRSAGSQQRRVMRHRKAKLFSQLQMMAWARYVTNGRYSESALQGSFTQWHDGPEFKTLTEWK